ncbi:MAG: sulfite exporter TauE/SafE family protein [Gemmatimonadetes bacterium]|nr:sulfite exporter TauE/SafE family protein [Gemmatimonadota bacterium]
MTALAVSVFVAALLGSAHCAGMCGGLACFVAGTGTPDVRGTAGYNVGRLLSYASLGALAGMAGAGFDRAGQIAGFARPAAIVAGALMIVWGGASALAASGVRVPQLAVPAFVRAALAAAMRAVRDRPPLQRGLALGILTPLLPCGWLYAFVATSAAAGTAPLGAFVMSAFWLGTLPAMAALGLGAQRALGPLHRRMPAITAAAMMVIGLLTVVGKFGPPMAHDHAGAHASHADGHQP